MNYALTEHQSKHLKTLSLVFFLPSTAPEHFSRNSPLALSTTLFKNSAISAQQAGHRKSVDKKI